MFVMFMGLFCFLKMKEICKVLKKFMECFVELFVYVDSVVFEDKVREK